MSAQIVYVTCPPGHAEALASILIRARVAACVTILPQVHSVYRWQGEVQKDAESLLLIKTTSERFETLKAEVLMHHPYELPEIVAVNVAQGHTPYLDWIEQSCAV